MDLDEIRRRGESLRAEVEADLDGAEWVRLPGMRDKTLDVSAETTQKIIDLNKLRSKYKELKKLKQFLLPPRSGEMQLEFFEYEDRL